MFKSVFSIGVLILAVSVQIAFSQACVVGDVVELDDFSDATQLLQVNGGGDDEEVTFGVGPFAAITNRTLRIESSAANATAQILAGAAALSASNNDFFGQILYSYAFPIPISNFGDGVYVTVSQMSGDMSLTLFGMDRDSNGDLFYSTAGLSISGPGTYSADFDSFTDLDSGHPVNFAALDGLGVAFENSSSGPSSITLTSFGLTFTPVPEPSSAVLLGLALLFGLAFQSRSRETSCR